MTRRRAISRVVAGFAAMGVLLSLTASLVGGVPWSGERVRPTTFATASIGSTYDYDTSAVVVGLPPRGPSTSTTPGHNPRNGTLLASIQAADGLRLSVEPVAPSPSTTPRSTRAPSRRSGNRVGGRHRGPRRPRGTALVPLGRFGRFRSGENGG